MKIEKYVTMLIMALMFIVGATFAFAVIPGEAYISDAADLGEYILQSPDTITAEAGNISQANVDANMSTYRWAGLVGNVTGSIILGDANEDVMFEWSAVGNLVFASQSATVTWTALADAAPATVVSAYTYLTTGMSDAYDTTFTEAAENIGSNIFTTLTSDFALTWNNESTPTWKTYSLTDGSAIVFAGLVSEDGTDYAGNTIDYQIILPEDGTAGNIVTQTYNLWIELE